MIYRTLTGQFALFFYLLTNVIKCFLIKLEIQIKRVKAVGYNYDFY